MLWGLIYMPELWFDMIIKELNYSLWGYNSVSSRESLRTHQRRTWEQCASNREERTTEGEEVGGWGGEWVLSAPRWHEESCGVGEQKWRVRRWRGRKGRERRRSSRIKRREAEPGCEPGWRGCSAGTWVHTNSQPPRSSPARESEAQSTVWKRERKGGREEEEENEVDRVREEEKGRSERPEMRSKGKVEEGVDEGSWEEETKGGKWMDGSMNGQMDGSGEEVVRKRDRRSVEKCHNSKIIENKHRNKVWFEIERRWVCNHQKWGEKKRGGGGG